MGFLNDYNDIITLHDIELDELAKEKGWDNDPEDIAAEKEAAINAGLTIKQFRSEREKFWDNKRNWETHNGLWEIKVFIYFIYDRLKVDSYFTTFTTWILPNGYELTYTDYTHSWSLRESGSLLDTKHLVNDVYCKKGLLYKFLCNYMRKRAAELRGIQEWRELDKLSKEAPTYYGQPI